MEGAAAGALRVGNSNRLHAGQLALIHESAVEACSAQCVCVFVCVYM